MTTRLTIAAALALGGCMKIYPSTELPDLEIDWYAESCGPDAPDVAITLVGLDDGSTQERIVPCADGGVTIGDADRSRYRIDGTLQGPGGDFLAMSSQEVDLRNGIDASASLYFETSSLLRITWEFAGGSTCEALEADTIDLVFFEADFGPHTTSTSCAFGQFVGNPYGTDLTVELRAVSRRRTVAVSERSGPITVMPPDPLLVGPLVLVPCGADCP